MAFWNKSDATNGANGTNTPTDKQPLATEIKPTPAVSSTAPAAAAQSSINTQVPPSANAAATGVAGVGDEKPQIDSETLEKIVAIRTKLHEAFGKIALALMSTPRYRSLSISDLNQLALDPLMRDRVAMATAASKDGKPDEGALSGIAFWASVSPEVDAKIREQIKAGIFPVRLKPEEWNSGSINWLLDVIAPNQRLTMAVIANFRQVVKEGDMRIHPIVTRLVDPEALKKMGAAPINASTQDVPGAQAGSPTVN